MHVSKDSMGWMKKFWVGKGLKPQGARPLCGVSKDACVAADGHLRCWPGFLNLSQKQPVSGNSTRKGGQLHPISLVGHAARHCTPLADITRNAFM